MKYTKEELVELITVQQLPYEQIGKMYGITGSAIRKAAKKFEIELPKRRSINESETFNKGINFIQNETILDTIPDEILLKYVSDCKTWKDLGILIGYKAKLNKTVKDEIINRCNKHNVTIEFTRKLILPDTKEQMILSCGDKISFATYVRKDSRRIYKESGKEYKCSICGYDTHVEIAHIKAVADFNNEALLEEINSIDNLIALCPNHHWEYDNQKLKL